MKLEGRGYLHDLGFSTALHTDSNAHYAMPWILWPTKDHWVFRQTSKEAPKIIERSRAGIVAENTGGIHMRSGVKRSRSPLLEEVDPHCSATISKIPCPPPPPSKSPKHE